MKKRNNGVVIAIIVIIAAVIFFLMAKLSNMVQTNAQRMKDAQREMVANELSSFDYMVYWIGTPPQGLTDLLEDNITVLRSDNINEDTMPVGSHVMEVVREDKNGYSFGEHSRDEYRDRLFIIIDSSEELSSEQWEIVRICVVENQVPVLLIGEGNINAFRRLMLMSTRPYNENSSFFYSADYGVDSIKLEEEDVRIGGLRLTGAILDFTVELFTKPLPTPVVVGTVETSETIDSGVNVIIETMDVDPSGEALEENLPPDVTIETTIIYYYGN